MELPCYSLLPTVDNELAAANVALDNRSLLRDAWDLEPGR